MPLVTIELDELHRLRALANMKPEECTSNIFAGIRLPEQQADLAIALAVHGSFTNARILSKWYDHRADPPSDEQAIIKVLISRVRKALAPLGVTIHLNYGYGYYVTPEDQRKLRDAMGRVTAS